MKKIILSVISVVIFLLANNFVYGITANTEARVTYVVSGFSDKILEKEAEISNIKDIIKNSESELKKLENAHLTLTYEYIAIKNILDNAKVKLDSLNDELPALLDEYEELTKKKLAMYHVKGQTDNRDLFDLEGYITLHKDFNSRKIYSSYYLKYIFEETIGGQTAFCLNPGLSCNGSYTALSTETRNFNDLDLHEQMYAVIYNTNFRGLSIRYSTATAGTQSAFTSGLPCDKTTDYIIKQLLFWAYEGSSTLEFNLGAETVQYRSGRLYYPAEGYASTVAITWGDRKEILLQDICTAVLHYAQLKNPDAYSVLKDDFYLKDDVEHIDGGTVYNRNKTIVENYILTSLSQTYQKLKADNSEVTITLYKPDSEKTNNPDEAVDKQFFVGIYVPPPPDDTPVDKYYAVVNKLGNEYELVSGYKKFSSDVKETRKDTYSNYTYKSVHLKKSTASYSDPITLVKEVPNSYTPSTSTSYTLDFDTAAEYNVIVFEYDYTPPGTLTVQKKIRYNDGTVSGVIGTPTKYTLSENKEITIGESLANNGTTYYYFKYSYGSTTKYHNAGSTVTIPKGTSDVTLTIYYGLRRIDYAHKIGDSTTLESNTMYKYENSDGTNWGSIPNLVLAKSTPWYTTVGNTYLKLNYVKGKYKNATTTVAQSSVKYSGTDSGTEFTSTSFGLGAMGAKDNDSTRIHFYYEVINSTKVVVRHFVKQTNGTYALNNGLANSQTVAYNGEQAYSGVTKASYTVVNNKYSQRKSVKNNTKSILSDTEVSALYAGTYSEFYEIDKNDKVIIDRSRILLSDGTYYKCQGFKTKTTTSATNDLTVSVSGVNTTSSLRQTVGGTSGYVYIDYYYEPVTYSLYVSGTNSISNSAKLKYMPKAAGTYTSLGANNSVVNSTVTGAKESANIAYVPVTENLKPYVVTDKFRVRTARYGISLSGNTMVYNLSSYQTWGVSDDSNMASVGSIVGSGNDKLVYETGKGYLNVKNGDTLTSEIAATYNTVKNISGAFTGNATNAHSTFNSILTSVASSKTNEAFYSDSANYNIVSTKYNGLRNTTGSINYKIYTVTSSGITSKTTNYASSISQDNSMSVNIYTPVAVGEAAIKSIDFVNHSNVSSSSTSIVQQGITFSITVSAKKDTAYTASVYNKITNTGKYIKFWYLMFDFDVTYNGVTYAADTPIRFNANTGNKYAETTITGLQATTTSTDKEIIESTLNHVKVIAATVNLPSANDYAYGLTQLYRTTANKSDTNVRHIDNQYVKQRTSTSSPQSQNDGLGMQYDSYYVVSNMQETVSIGRLFDFEITDCLDVNFKDVFRILTNEEDTKNSNYSPINVLTGTRYFSGIRRLMATDSVTSTMTNNLVNRGNLTVGAVTKILPLGPYKHTTNTYIKAVKLGYRFSFDLKTSGYYSPKENTAIERYVKITPSYYYISKDGKTYNGNIKLYYKNSAGNYIDFETSNYTIYYKPDDGYRNLYNSSTYSETDVSKTTKDGVTTLTSSLVGLNIGNTSGFKLSDTKSMTISDEGYLQAWYGEFKLPNSTIALAKDANGNVDINNPLTNGYIGVKFDIECIDTYTNNRTVTISYDSNDTGIGKNQVNTSQWDYEGYLGFKESNIGKELQNNINIQLENGIWSVDANMYKTIKGTVIFYDLDDRAANDYE